MRTINDLREIRLTDIRVEPINPGEWRVYEPGDTLPDPPPAGPEPRVISVQDFRSRFADPELAGIVSSTDVSVKVLLVKLQTRADVDLDDPQVIGGLDLLASKGLLTAPRRAVIGA